MRKGRKSTKGLVPIHGINGTPNSDLTDYTPPMVLEDLDKIKSRIRKATYTGRELNQLAKVFTVDVLTLLVRCVNDEAQVMADRLRAGEILVNRGWGRPKETVDITNTSITVSAPDIMALINARRSQAVDIVNVSEASGEGGNSEANEGQESRFLG